MVAVCGGGSDNADAKKPDATTTAPSTTTTTVFVPTAPLTGLPDPSGASQTRASLGVKIENTPESRPQSGLDVADIVYEEMVEGGITRFWAFFNSAAPEVVGPIRSVRFMDPNIVWPFGGVIAYSGGTNDNVALIRQAPVEWVDENNGATRSSARRRGSHPTTCTATPPSFGCAGGDPKPPRAMFTYLGKGETFAGEGIDQFHLGFQAGYDPTYTYDPASHTWKRSYGLTPFMDVSGSKSRPRT